jgi:hypothetical protein
MGDYDLEADLESRIVKFCKKHRLPCLKLVLLGMRGFPDRTIITHKGVLFLELKRKRGGSLEPQQSHWLKTLAAMRGCESHKVDTFEKFLKLVGPHLEATS